eukprot:6479460-Amphidinium_carterae.1
MGNDQSDNLTITRALPRHKWCSNSFCQNPNQQRNLLDEQGTQFAALWLHAKELNVSYASVGAKWHDRHQITKRISGHTPAAHN